MLLPLKIKNCKQRELLAYFGQTKKENCGNCSSQVCQGKSKKKDINIVIHAILELLAKEALSPHQLKLSLPSYPTTHIAEAIEQLEDQHKIKRNTLDQYNRT